MEELVTLVNEQDEQVGTMEKLSAHQEGSLHRALSVVVYNEAGEMLIQKRAGSKYHSPSLWSNACCSHPRPNELTSEAVARRLQEEIGLTCETHFSHKFIYKVDFENGLIEHELDHVFVGKTDQLPILNPEEASEYRFVPVPILKNEMVENPESFTFWFHLIMKELHP